MGHCPIINVPGRTFPVTPYFLEDAIEISQYCLSQASDSPYVQRKQRRNNANSVTEGLSDSDAAAEDESLQLQTRDRYSKPTRVTLEVLNEHMINFDLIIALLTRLCFTNEALQMYSKAILIFLPSLDSIRTLCDQLGSHQAFGSELFQIFPLHSSVSNDQQGQVFKASKAHVVLAVITVLI